MKIVTGFFFLLLPLLCLAQKPQLVIPVGHTSFIQSAVFSSNSRYALTCSLDRTIKIWDVEQGVLIHTFDTGDLTIRSAQFLPNPNKIIAIDINGKVLEGDIISGEISQKLETYTHIQRAAFSRDGSQLVATGDPRRNLDWLYLVDISTNKVEKIRSVRSGPGPSRGGLHFPATFTSEGLRWISLSPGGITIESIGGTIAEVKGFEGGTPAVVFSEDATMMVTIDNNGRKVELWNAKTGALIRSLGNLGQGSVRFYRMSFSPDNQEIVIGDNYGKLTFINLETRNSIHRVRDRSEINAVTYSPDGAYVLVGGTTGRASIWKREDHTLLHLLSGKTAPISEVKLAPDGHHLLISDWEAKAQLWNLQTGQLKHTFAGFTGDFHPSKNQLLTGVGKEAILWDLKTQGILDTFQLPEKAVVQQVSFVDKGEQALIAGLGNVQLRDLASRSKINMKDGAYIGLGSYGEGITQSPFLITVDVPWLENYPDAWDIHFVTSPQNTFLRKDHALYKLEDLKKDRDDTGLDLQKDNLFASSISDEKDLLLAGGEGEYVLWNTKALQEVRRFQTPYGMITSCLFNSSGNQFLTGHSKGQLVEWESDGSGSKGPFNIHKQSITTLTFLSDDQFLISGSMDHAIKFWSYPLKNDIELATMYKIGQEDWVITTPSGLFDASPGAMLSMHYVVPYQGDWEIIELEQLKARYYEPGVLQKLLGFNEERIRPVDDLKEIKLYPGIETAIITNDSLLIKLKERNGGIGSVSIFINGKEVLEEANPLPRRDNAKRDSNIHLDLQPYRKYFLKDSISIISIRAYNEEGWLKSPAYQLEYQPPRTNTKGNELSEKGAAWSGKEDPKLFVVSIGTSNYAGTKLDLQYADQDATMMSKALHSVGTALFSNEDAQEVEVYCFTTANEEPTGLENPAVQWQFANKKNIKARFEAIKKEAKAEDVVVVYLSGHGVTYGSAEEAQFHYLTQGIASENLSDLAIRQAYTISSNELTKWINDIPALKQVLIIDACNSGQIVENLTGGTKSLNSSQVRALDRMKDRTGMFVLSGSASDKVSYEASEYGQGLLTYALLQGMLGVATRKDTKGQETIDVVKLFQYARDQVPILANSINGIQTPMLGFPYQAASFDIGILDKKARQSIPIGNKKPVLVKSLFMDKNTFQDDLKLAERLEVAFREETEKGSGADLIYVDVYNYPNAFSVSGLYEKTEEGIKIEVKLFKDRKPIADLEISPSDDPKRLARNIARAVKKQLLELGND